MTKASGKYVWVIEHGSYSDYSVVGVYDSYKKASMVCELINSGDPYEKATVSRWPMNPACDEVMSGKKLFHVVMAMDGTTEDCRESSSLLAYEIQGGGLNVWKRTQAAAWRDKPIQDAVNGSVWAKDKKHAVKIANEFRARAIADNKMSRRD